MEVHIGHAIKEKLEKSGMKKSEFARRINKTSQNVYDIFERKSIDTALLGRISEVLEFNFFELLSYRFVAADTDDQKLLEMASAYTSTSELIQALRDKEHERVLCSLEVKQLQKEIAYLKQINELLRGKKKL